MRQVSKDWLDTLLAIQRHFHALMRSRAGFLIDRQNLALPDVHSLLESESPGVFFPIPGMYGGFRYWLEGEGDQSRLISISFCRVVGGSGQRHEVTAEGSLLVEEGFI